MKAIEEFRKKLDELGIEWGVMLHPDVADHSVTYKSNGVYWVVIENQSGSMRSLTNYKEELSVEQVIAATIGADAKPTQAESSGTCHDSNKRFNALQCSECGATLLLMFDDYDEPTYSVNGVADVLRYCPNCGRKVVDE